MGEKYDETSRKARCVREATFRSEFDSLAHFEGCRMVPSNSTVLAKFDLCSNCSQKLDECSLARTRKNFASARMLGFSLKVPAV